MTDRIPSSPAIADWPEWLSPEYGAIHTAFENEFKRALDHCYGSADAAGMDWTTEGLFSVAASNICGLLRRLGCPPPPVGDVERLPMPEPEGEVYTEADCADEARIAWASAAVDLALSEGRSADEVTDEDARCALVVFDSLAASDVLAGYFYSRDALLRVNDHARPEDEGESCWLTEQDYRLIGLDRGEGGRSASCVPGTPSGAEASTEAPPSPQLPTRKQVLDALEAVYLDATRSPSSLSVGDIGRMTDAVMALLAGSPEFTEGETP